MKKKKHITNFDQFIASVKKQDAKSLQDMLLSSIFRDNVPEVNYLLTCTSIKDLPNFEEAAHLYLHWAVVGGSVSVVDYLLTTENLPFKIDVRHNDHRAMRNNHSEKPEMGEYLFHYYYRLEGIDHLSTYLDYPQNKINKNYAYFCDVVESIKNKHNLEQYVDHVLTPNDAKNPNNQSNNTLIHDANRPESVPPNKTKNKHKL